jgi:hypothetical protein
VGPSLAERICDVAHEPLLEHFWVLLDKHDEPVHRLCRGRFVVCRDYEQPRLLPGVFRRPLARGVD